MNLEENYSDAEKLKDYMGKHYIPNMNLSFENFEEFFSEREALLVAALKLFLMANCFLQQPLKSIYGTPLTIDTFLFNY